MHVVREALAITALLLLVLGPWIGVMAGSLVAYAVGRRLPRVMWARRLGVAAFVSLGVAVIAWVGYVAPALHKPGASCPDPSPGAVLTGLSAVVIPPVLLSLTAGATVDERRRGIGTWLATGVAFTALIALPFLQRGMFCHFGD